MSANWTEDEVVLICAEVKANGWDSIRADSLSARRLSVLLIGASKVPLNERKETFRSPGSIHRKSWDIITALPTYSGTPTKGGNTTREVVQCFLEEPDKMTQRAQEIKTQIVSSQLTSEGLQGDDEFGIQEASEGAEAEIMLIRRERSRSLRLKKISAVLGAGKKIECEVCGFDYSIIYGDRGDGYIEVHHVLPLHASGQTITRLGDLVLLCANCHRMIHRRHPWLEPDELKAIVASHS
ncbi:HNH endonuclease [Brevibacterium renqingii]|uniref:HNH endonuclease n=1 Tax=Brevibacterium renqingii TaxID=2776916 RepID=UPI001ADFEBF2|nr:HNH endonuclease [Brevibacterium renqingii]